LVEEIFELKVGPKVNECSKFAICAQAGKMHFQRREGGKAEKAVMGIVGEVSRRRMQMLLI
jgi:hypothetical protein